MPVESKILRNVALTVLGVSAIAAGVARYGEQIAGYFNLDASRREITGCVGSVTRGTMRAELQNKSQYRGWMDSPSYQLKVYNYYACEEWNFRDRIRENPGLQVMVCQGTKQLSVEDFIRELDRARSDRKWNFVDFREGYENAACPRLMTPRPNYGAVL
jgi:hypothetical protein